MRAALQARALHLADAKMAKGGYMADGAIMDELLDINGELIEEGDIVKTTQPSGGLLSPSEGQIGVVEKTKDAFGQDSFQIRFRKEGKDFDQYILINNKINEIIRKGNGNKMNSKANGGELHRMDDGEYKYGGYMAKGGATEHGLKMGDKIVAVQFWENSVVVDNPKTGRAVVYLETGKRKEESK